MATLHGWLVRRVTYPLSEWRRRGKVLSTLASLQQTQWLTLPELESLQFLRLRELITHAYARSPFYREAFLRAGLVPEDMRSLSDLRHLPVLEKADLRDRLPRLMTRPHVHGLIKRQTGGSTGIPVVLWVESWARDAWVAAQFRFMGWWGVRPGDRRVTLISRHGLTSKTWLKQYWFANVLEVPATDLSDAALARLFVRLSRQKVRALMGYPSSLTYFAQYIIARDLPRPPLLTAVFTTGEMLFDDQLKLLHRAFGCPIVNEYGSSEAGHMAGECPGGGLHIAAENLVVECILPDDAPSGPGELLVTDLTNYATPLIRYRIGDVGTFGAGCSCGRALPVLQRLAGRVSDVVVLPDGRRADFTLIASVLDNLVEEGLGLQQYRVIQRAVDWFEVLLAGPESLSMTSDIIVQRLSHAFRAPVHVTVRVVARIPSDPSGKRRRFISLVTTSAESGGAVPQA